MVSYRLNEIIELCGSAKRIADVGCDHGKVLGELAKKGAKYLVATDISEPSVRKAGELLNKINFKKFDVRVGNGCETLSEKDKLDMIVIAGMGGLEIIDILKNSPIELTNLVLQPQNNVVKLREYLVENNFRIIVDKVVEDKQKFYNILKVKKSDKKYELSAREIQYGKSNLKGYNPHFVLMLMEENEKLAARQVNVTNENIKNEMINTIIKNNKEIERANSRR